MARTKKRREAAERARKRAQEHKTGFDRTSLTIPEGVEMFKLDTDKPRRIDIMPFVAGAGNPWADEGQEHYERSFFVHKGIGVNGDSFICLAKTFNKRCPICDYQAKLKRDKDADPDLIKSLYPSERQLFNVIDTADREKGIQLWDVSHFLFGKLLDAKIKDQDEDDNYDMFMELEDGLTLKLGVSEETWPGGKYFKVSGIEFKTRKDNYDSDMLDKAHCLDDLLKELEYAELKVILLQSDPEEGEEEPGKDDDPEEGEEEPGKDDDPEEETPPPKKPGKCGAATPKGKSKGKKDTPECPVDGGEFGVSTEEYDDCDGCELWEDCDIAKSANANED